MTKIYSYILRYDDGAAPNPYGGICTLNICKPIIRRKAEVGDWVVGTGSKNTRLKDGKIYDFSNSLVYAMKVSNVLKMEEYDKYCKNELRSKMPDWFGSDFERKVGDCVYIFKNDKTKPEIRESIHNEGNLEKDLSGVNCLLSNHFYYFGEEARTIPDGLKSIIKISQGHKKVENENLIQEFEKWISQFERNKIYANPQLKFEFDKADLLYKSQCAARNLEDDEEDNFKVIC